MIKSLLVVAVTALYLKRCGEAHIVTIEDDFSKVKSDESLSTYVEEILQRLKTFKVPVHPRIRLFYQLLKKGMGEYADRTSDTIFVPFKYNTVKAKESKESKESEEPEEPEEHKESKESKASKDS